MKIIQSYVAFLFLFLFLPFNTAFSMDYYVSEKGSGVKNGTSVQNSWAGFSNIKWGTQNGQVGPGSNLYICGEIRSKLTVGISGKTDNPVVIRGDCPGNPGIINGANVVNGTWTLVSDNVYSIPVDTHVRGIVTEDDSALITVAWKNNAAITIAAMVAYGNGTWSYDSTNQILYVLTSATDSPASHAMEASYGQIYSSQVYVRNRSYVTIKNLTIKNFGDYGINFQSMGSNDIINKCTIYNGYNWAIFSQGIINMQVSNNTLHHVVWAGHLPLEIAVGEAVRFHKNTGGSIYGNTIYDTPAIGINLYGGTSGVNVYNNIVHDDLGTTTQYTAGIQTDDGQNNFIYDNLIYNEIVGIASQGNTITNSTSSGNIWYNNIVYNFANDGMYIGAYHTPWVVSAENFIYNNTIVAGPNSKGYALFIGTSKNDTFKNNIVYGSVTWYQQIYQSFGTGYFDYNSYFANFTSQNSGIQTFEKWLIVNGGDIHSTNTNQYIPGMLTTTFVNPKGLDFDLNSGSKPIGVGTNLSSIFTTDFKGNPRPSSGAWDAGAYESQ